jgi:hypothetical protein
MSLKKIKVVEVFFEEDVKDKDMLSPLPCYLLENGNIKRPIRNGDVVYWATDEELEKLQNDGIIYNFLKSCKCDKNGKRK